MSSEGCIFCRIVAGSIPAASVYEDRDILAFLDIAPIHEGHVLVIPKFHYATLDACSDLILARMSSVAARVARAVAEVTGCDGYNCLCNNGRAAGQIVDHVHFHIIPRYTGDRVFSKWPAGTYGEGRMKALAEKMQEKIALS